MVLDTSAMLAIQLREQGSEILHEKILAARRVVAGAPTVLECIMVMTSRIRRHDPRAVVVGFLSRIGAEALPFTPEHIQSAAEAFLRFGN